MNEFADERRLDGVYELIMSQMSVNACEENYSWINQPSDRIGLDRGTQPTSSILINLPGLYEVNFGLIFPTAWFTSNGKAQPQIRLLVNGQILVVLDENQHIPSPQINKFLNIHQIDENIKIFDGSEERYKTGLDSTRAINLDMPKQLTKAENKELPVKEL